MVHNSTTAVAVGLVLFLIFYQIKTFQQGNWLAVSAIVYYLTVATLFLLRKPSKSYSTRPMHWVAALGASWLPLFIVLQEPHFIPASPQWSWIPPLFHMVRHPLLTSVSIPIQVLGVGLTLVALTTLGRGFGVIAARRELRTTGVYRLVRHPIYAGATLAGLALVLQNPTLYNVCLLFTEIACQLLRIREEETVLGQDPAYRSYQQQVPWRLVPGVF
jgi:steroid 5-alpha reductase family enzyme